MPTVEEFATTFLSLSAMDNKPSSVESKNQILRTHLRPFFGKRRLDDVTYASIQDFKAKKLSDELSKKSTNNLLSVLHRLLVVARKRGLIDKVPEFEWFKCERPEFDFLTFEEAQRILAACESEPEWRTMVPVGIRTGLRQGELLGLRWRTLISWQVGSSFARTAYEGTSVHQRAGSLERSPSAMKSSRP